MGARRDGDIVCWDVRGSLEPLYRIRRETRTTNQRIQFSIEPCGRHLATGAASKDALQLPSTATTTAFAAVSSSCNP
jgi:hypothetical protein